MRLEMRDLGGKRDRGMKEGGIYHGMGGGYEKGKIVRSELTWGSIG